MNKVLTLLKGRKTYLLVLVYVVFVLVQGHEPAGESAIAGLDPDAIKEALLGLMVASGKAAWDRFAKDSE